MSSRARLGWFLARRYLSSRSGGNMLSFITWIALGGVVVGVTALIVVIGVMTGAQEELREKILGSNPHVMVLQSGPTLRLDNYREVMETVVAQDDVVSAAPFLLTRVGLYREGYVEVVDLYGVELNEEAPPVTAMEDSLRSGGVSLEPGTSGLPVIALGSSIASRMNLFVGDTVTVVALENLKVGPFGELAPDLSEYEVSATFTTGMYDYDLRNGYTAIENVQDILALSGEVAGGLGVRVEDPWQAEAVAEDVREALGGWPYYVDPWTRTNAQLFSALKLEKFAMGLILSLIILVAAFNIVSTLVMVVVNRTREIGILKAMGLTRRDTLRTFMYQGIWIGAIGTLAGLTLGLTLAFLIERYQLIPFPAEVYFIDRLPVTISVSDVAWIAAVSMLISLLATIYPARQASSLEPVDAIRHE
ncbi:MAG: ABC transporter permease [Gemmatimonadetes bacterium]|nr:ABC transporter permease [Gemmatimonadota bacterium]